jgi:hypothetical protein
MLLASGTESDVTAAKAVAMRTATRIEYILTERLKVSNPDVGNMDTKLRRMSK